MNKIIKRQHDAKEERQCITHCLSLSVYNKLQDDKFLKERFLLRPQGKNHYISFCTICQPLSLKLLLTITIDDKTGLKKGNTKIFHRVKNVPVLCLKEQILTKIAKLFRFGLTSNECSSTMLIADEKPPFPTAITQSL